MKGFVVLSFPKHNAIEVAARLLRTAELADVPNAVNFENLPYLVPTCGCACGGSHASEASGSACQTHSRIRWGRSLSVAG